MPITPSPRTPDQTAGEEDNQVFCSNCRTSDYIAIESIQPLVPKRFGWVAAEYSCGRCEYFYAAGVPVQALARFMASVSTPSGVLKFGRHYIHCGEPMEEFRRHGQGASGDVGEAREAGVPLVVLRCVCGFQMTLPA